MAPHRRFLALAALAALAPGCGGARLDMKAKVLSLMPREGPLAQTEDFKAHPAVERASSAIQDLVSWLQSQGAQEPAEAPVQPSETFIRDATSSAAMHQNLKQRLANSTARDVVRWLNGGREPEEEPVLPGESLVRDSTSSLHLHHTLKEKAKESEWGKKLQNATLKDAVRWLNGGREPQEEPVMPGEALVRDSLSSLDLHRSLKEKLKGSKVEEKLHDAASKVHDSTLKDAVRWLNGGREPQEEPVLPGEALTRDSTSSLDLHRSLTQKLKESKVEEKLHETAAKLQTASLKDAVRWLNGGREPQEEPVLPGEALTRDSTSSLDLHRSLKKKLQESKVEEKLNRASKNAGQAVQEFADRAKKQPDTVAQQQSGSTPHQ